MVSTKASVISSKQHKRILRRATDCKTTNCKTISCITMEFLYCSGLRALRVAWLPWNLLIHRNNSLYSLVGSIYLACCFSIKHIVLRVVTQCTLHMFGSALALRRSQQFAGYWRSWWAPSDYWFEVLISDNNAEKSHSIRMHQSMGTSRSQLFAEDLSLFEASGKIIVLIPHGRSAFSINRFSAYQYA